jgi:hypothetical protein
LTQLVALTASKSALARSMPVSSTATPVVLAPCACVGLAAPTRRMPAGTVSPATTGSPVAVTSESAVTKATLGSACSRASCRGVTLVEKPASAAS